MDCERVYGRILDNKNVESSVRAEPKELSRKIWTEFYPEEPFELDCSTISSQKCVDVNFGAAGAITYDFKMPSLGFLRYIRLCSAAEPGLRLGSNL